MVIKFIVGFLISMALSQLFVSGLKPTLYFNGKRVHHAHLGLFYLFVVLPVFLVAWATNNINYPVMIGLVGVALGVLIHDFFCHLFDHFFKKNKK